MAVGNIPIHFDQTGGTSSFTYSFGTCKAKNNKLEFKYDEDRNKWLRVSKDDTLINLTAGANTDPDRNVDVGIYLNSNPCGYFNVVQSGINCSCDDATFNAEGVAAFNKDAHPNAVIGSYTASTDCITNVDVINGSAIPGWLTNVNINTSDKTITGNISANTSSEARETVTINLRGTLKPSGTCDRSITVNQNGTGCKCGDSTFKITTASPIQKQSEGGNFEFSYIASDCVKSVSNPTVSSGGERWISGLELLDSDKKVTGTVSSYSEATTRSATITIKGTLQDGTTECTSSIDIEQAGIACSCDNLSIPSIIDSIPSNGLAIDTVIATYSITNNCPQADYTATLTEGGNNYTVLLSGGNVILKTKIEEIERDSQAKTFVLKFKYKDSDCCPRLCYELVQESVPCSCESIDYFVVSLKRTFPVSGTGVNYAIIASGDTFGCGELSAVTNSVDMFGGDGELVRETHAENPSLTEYQFIFKGKVLPLNLEKYPERYLPVDTRIYFRKKDETEFQDCDRVIRIIQSDNYCDCTVGKMWVRPYSSYYDDVDCQEHSGYRSIEVATSTCATITATTANSDWITINAFSNHKLTVDLTKNTGETRTGYVHVTSLVDVDPGHPSGVICEEADVKIVQKGCVPCDCDNLNPRLYYPYCGSLEFNETGKALVNWVAFDSTCEGKLYTKEMEEQGIEPEVGDYRLVFCDWKEGEDHSWIDGDPYFEDDYIYVDVNSQNPTNKDRSVNLNVAVEYYRKGYVEGDYFWDGGCQGDWDCYLSNACLTQKRNPCKDCSNLQKDFYTNTQIDCTKHNEYIIGSRSAKEICGYYFSGYTCDAEGTPSSYTWVTITNSPTPLTYDILYADFEENPNDEPRTAYIYAYLTDEYGTPIDFGNPPDPEDPDTCGQLLEITQKAGSEPPCDCDSYNLNIQTRDYEDEFIDGDGIKKVAKIYKNETSCLNVRPVLGQHDEYLSVTLESLDDTYDEVVVNIKDSATVHAEDPTIPIITTDIVVAIGIVVSKKDDPTNRCDEGDIHITIHPKP